MAPKKKSQAPVDDPQPSPDTPGEADIATLSKKSYKGEFAPPIPVGAWVRLKADGDAVPDRFDGRVAMVTESRTFSCDCDFSPRTHEHQAEDAAIGVRLRDETGALLTITQDHISEWSIDGRHGVMAHG